MQSILLLKEAFPQCLLPLSTFSNNMELTFIIIFIHLFVEVLGRIDIIYMITCPRELS